MRVHISLLAQLAEGAMSLSDYDQIANLNRTNLWKLTAVSTFLGVLLQPNATQSIRLDLTAVSLSVSGAGRCNCLASWYHRNNGVCFHCRQINIAIIIVIIRHQTWIHTEKSTGWNGRSKRNFGRYIILKLRDSEQPNAVVSSKNSYKFYSEKKHKTLTFLLVDAVCCSISIEHWPHKLWS